MWGDVKIMEYRGEKRSLFLRTIHDFDLIFPAKLRVRVRVRTKKIKTKKGHDFWERFTIFNEFCLQNLGLGFLQNYFLGCCAQDGLGLDFCATEFSQCKHPKSAIQYISAPSSKYLLYHWDSCMFWIGTGWQFAFLQGFWTLYRSIFLVHSWFDNRFEDFGQNKLLGNDC